MTRPSGGGGGGGGEGNNSTSAHSSSKRYDRDGAHVKNVAPVNFAPAVMAEDNWALLNSAPELVADSIAVPDALILNKELKQMKDTTSRSESVSTSGAALKDYCHVGPPVANQEESGLTTTAGLQSERQVVSPGAVFVGGGSLVGGTAPTQPQPLLTVDVVSEEDVRKRYFSDARDELLVNAVKAERVDEVKKSRFGLWSIILLIVVLTAVVIAVVVPLTRKRDHDGRADASQSLGEQTCAKMTDSIMNSVTVSHSALSRICDSIEQEGERCTYDASVDTMTRASANCSQLNGYFVDEEFAVICNSSVPNRTFFGDFRHVLVCVAATCDAGQVQSYLEAQIDSATQFLENEGNLNCKAIHGTYKSSQRQQELFLPSIWGERCAAESDNVSISDSFNAFVLPRCKRNDTGSICTLDFTLESTEVGPSCQGNGGRFLTFDFQFQCISQNGSIYTIKHLNKPTCIGFSCSVSQVARYHADLVRSSLAYQGFRKCQLLSSITNQNVSEQQLNTSLASIGNECAVETAMLSNNTSLAALYAIVSASALTSSCENRTTDFSVEAIAALEHHCSEDSFVLQDFTIGCDSPGGGSCVYSFGHAFLCLGRTCSQTEVETYLDGAIVWLSQSLETGGHVQNCRVLSEDYQIYDADAGLGPKEYLPSVSGEDCATENHQISSNATIATLINDNIIMASCQRKGSEGTCTFNYIGANSKVEVLCPLLGGSYSKIDFAVTCASEAVSTLFVFQYLNYPLCSGISCNVNQSITTLLQSKRLQYERYAGLKNCQLLPPPYQKQNVSGELCALETNILNVGQEWSEQIDSTFEFVLDQFLTNGRNDGTDRKDFSKTTNQSKLVCADLRGQYAELNATIGNCASPEGRYHDLSYVQNPFCFGLSCNVTQIQAFLYWAVWLDFVQQNCSKVDYLNGLTFESP